MMYLLAEFQKIKRNNTIFIVIVATFFINLMSVFQTNYDGTFSFKRICRCLALEPFMFFISGYDYFNMRILN